MRIGRESVVSFLLLAGVAAWGQTQATPATKTQVVILGTGTPRPDPDRSGPAVCVVVNGTPYLVDFGPGVVRRAAAAERKGVSGCAPSKIKVAFATHLHSDHTAGLSDLYLTPAVTGRGAALELYGPAGLKDMAEHIRAAYAKDFKVRTEGLEQGNAAAYELRVHEIKPGVVYKDANVTVTAFAVPHGTWDEALAFRFDAADKSIVISGDTAATEAIVRACHGCDVLLHEVYSMTEASTPRATERKKWPEYLKNFHTSTKELAAIAEKAQPKLLVLYHQLYGTTDDAGLVREVEEQYKGKVVSAKDLDVY